MNIRSFLILSSPQWLIWSCSWAVFPAMGAAPMGHIRDASSDQVTHQWFDVLTKSYKCNESKFSNEVHHLVGINGIVNLMITSR